MYFFSCQRCVDHEIHCTWCKIYVMINNHVLGLLAGPQTEILKTSFVIEIWKQSILEMTFGQQMDLTILPDPATCHPVTMARQLGDILIVWLTHWYVWLSLIIIRPFQLASKLLIWWSHYDNKNTPQIPCDLTHVDWGVDSALEMVVNGIHCAKKPSETCLLIFFIK